MINENSSTIPAKMEPDPSDFNLDFTQHNPAICLTNSAGFYRNATSPKVPGNFQGISS